ncbi:MAG: chromosomal replication initiator protein DnaA [Candidatus Pacebacteria bacterium]|jgi:chromosomal replication initiator protein|nr:chromosomal replication initiator protein DnaA [Candidatus Paceibacterota bacterium]
MIDSKRIWDTALTEIEAVVSKANFNTWFKNTRIVREDGGTIFIGVPNEFVKDWLNKKYHKLIAKTLRDSYEQLRSVEYIIAKYDQKEEKQEPVKEHTVTINKELPLGDLYINKEDNLNPKYTLDAFIVGSFNELAHAASQAIIQNPGTNYNPFFIYGGTGLGKTHLIQAVGNEIKKKFSDKKVHYVSFEKFSNDYISAVQNKTINIFKEKYRKYDLLIIDDIQFITGKEKTQDELFHLFNTLYEKNKQIVFSSDKHPNFIIGLEDRLKSRFSAGMIVDVQEPDYESRVAILKAKARANGLEIGDDIIDYLASSIQGNIRELEGTLNSIICHIQLKQRPLSVLEVKSLIKNNIKPKKNVAVKDVVKTIADFFNIEENTIYEKTRRKEIVKARQITMYVLREDFNVSYPSIGQKLGGKDHTTVIHSCLKIKNDLKNNPLLVQEIEQIRALFKS